jgi:hypothetical protein
MTSPPLFVSVIIATIGIAAVLWALLSAPSAVKKPMIRVAVAPETLAARIKLALGILILFGFSSVAAYAAFQANDPDWAFFGWLSIGITLTSMSVAFSGNTFSKMVGVMFMAYGAVTAVAIIATAIFSLFVAVRDGAAIFATPYTVGHTTVTYYNSPALFWVSVGCNTVVLAVILSLLRSYLFAKRRPPPSA